MGTLFDTNVLILHVLGHIRLEIIPGESALSVLTVFEALRLPGLSEKEEEALNALIRFCEIIPVTEDIAREAARIGRTRRGHGNDIVIAATALQRGMQLLTRNVKDFRGIRGLTLKDAS